MICQERLDAALSLDALPHRERRSDCEQIYDSNKFSMPGVQV